MIETSNPEIDVNQLMERVRREAGRLRSNAQIVSSPGANARRPILPIVPEPLAAPPLTLSHPIDPAQNRTEEKLQKARGMIEVSTSIPKMFRRLFRRQGGFNRATLETVTSLAKSDLKLQKRVRELTTAMEQQSQWTHLLVEQRQTESAWMRAAGALISSLEERLSSATAATEQLPALRSQLEGHGQHLQNLQTQWERQTEHLKSLQARMGQLEQHGQHLRNLQVQVDRQGEHSLVWREESHRNTEHLRALQEQNDRLGVHLQNVQGEINQRAQHLHEYQQLLLRLEERQLNDAIYIKRQISHQAMRLQQAGSPHLSVDALPSQSENSARADWHAHDLDTFYLSFENHFRGERAEIKRRVRFYLPFLQSAFAGVSGRPILDLGCGRGEWLELLREEGLEAAGVDLNPAMISQCAERGLAATHADAVDYLRSQADESLGAVTGFHIIEHLPLATLINLCAEALRVLKPGGLVICESPNCKNLMVGACNFNVDPTHRNPIYPETAEFILNTQGFEKIQLEYLTPVDTSSVAGSDEMPAALHRLLYGPQDFAVIGRKPDRR